MFWASVDFIFINDQIFNFGSVGTFLGGFLIPFYMTLVVFDSFVSVWSDRNFPASYVFSLGPALVVLPRFCLS